MCNNYVIVYIGKDGWMYIEVFVIVFWMICVISYEIGIFFNVLFNIVLNMFKLVFIYNGIDIGFFCKWIINW